jgi:hypothetical protein
MMTLDDALARKGFIIPALVTTTIFTDCWTNYLPSANSAIQYHPSALPLRETLPSVSHILGYLLRVSLHPSSLGSCLWHQ